MPTTDAKKVKAARILATGGSQAKAATAAGVHRSTLKRWLDEPDFNDLVLQQHELQAEPDPLEAAAEKGLGDLVPQALSVLEDALTGGAVTAAKARVALDIIKAAATLHTTEAMGASPSFASLLEKLDERDSRSD